MFSDLSGSAVNDMNPIVKSPTNMCKELARHILLPERIECKIMENQRVQKKMLNWDRAPTSRGIIQRSSSLSDSLDLIKKTHCSETMEPDLTLCQI